MCPPQLQAPPQAQPPPAGAPKSSPSESDEPAMAKLETRTRVRRDSQLGQTWPRSRSANEVSTSNVPEQSWQRYS